MRICGKKQTLVFTNVSTHINTSRAWGGAKKVEPPLIKDCTIGQPPKRRADMYDVTHTEWNQIDAGSIEEYIEQGQLVTGMAGTGKSTKLRSNKNILRWRNLYADEPTQFRTACPTHKACKHVNGSTIHRFFWY